MAVTQKTAHADSHRVQEQKRTTTTTGAGETSVNHSTHEFDPDSGNGSNYGSEGDYAGLAESVHQVDEDAATGRETRDI